MKRFRVIWSPLLLTLLIAAGSPACCKRGPEKPDPSAGPVVAIRNSEGVDHAVKVELAVTDAEKAKGLMYRWSLEEDRGMLFYYDDVRVRSFWMKNTRIPLDMIFIGPESTIVGIVENAEPHTLTSRTVGVPSRHVLEVNGGWCERHGVKTGDRVYFFGIGED